MPGCVAVGQTQEQVCENMRREIACYVASMDGICPQQLDLVVGVSIRTRTEPEPRPPIETPRSLDICRKLPVSVQSAGR